MEISNNGVKCPMVAGLQPVRCFSLLDIFVVYYC